jgi:CRP-like cAMP-binding protein
VFFIKSGRILFKASNGVVFRSYVSGSYFGEIELLGNSTRINSAQVSASPSELLALSKKFLEVVFKDYPEIYNEINALASVRQKVNSEAMAHALKLEINYSDLEKNDSLMSSSDSLSQFISEPEEEAQASGHQTWLQRRDTGVMVANLTISPRKVQNITRWSNAVQQMPRSKTQINNTNALLLKERQKDMKRQASLRSRQKKYKLKKLKKCMKVYEKVKCIDIQENQSFYDHSDQKIIKHDFIVSGLLDEVSRIDNLMLNHAANSLNLIQKINFEQEECLINLETLKQLINSKRNSDYYTNIQLYTLNMTSQAYININHR